MRKGVKRSGVGSVISIVTSLIPGNRYRGRFPQNKIQKNNTKTQKTS